MKKAYYMIGIWALAVLILDQLLKFVALSFWETPLKIGAWISLRYEQNSGIAWSIPLPYIWIIIISTGLLLILPFFVAKNFDLKHPLSQWLISLLLGGVMGNLFDRIVRGFVIDYLAIWWWPVFNLADVAITASIFLLMAFYDKINRKNLE